MLDWKRNKLEELAAISRALDADSISLLKGCSDFAKVVLRSGLLSCVTEQIGEAFNQYRWRVMDEQRRIPPEKVIRTTEIWDFLNECQTYVLNNPGMLFAYKATFMINSLEFGPLGTYLFFSNGFKREVNSETPDWLSLYIEEFILPSSYDGEAYKQMLAYKNGSLLSVSDYYRMATDEICNRYGLRPGFMMELCLAHCIFEGEESISDCRVQGQMQY